MMANKSFNNCLIAGITILFIVSAISPMTIGTNKILHSEEYSPNLDNHIFYASSDGNYRNESFFLNKYFKNSLNSNESVALEETFSKSLQYGVEKQSTPASNRGPMDSPWPMQSYNTYHLGRSPHSTADNPGIEKWIFYTEGWVQDTPVIDNNGTIYFGNYDFYLFAIYPNGTLKWNYFTYGRISSSPAIAEDGTIYVGSWDDYLYALYPNGTRKWRFNAHDTIASSPAIADDGTIYFGTMGTGHSIYAVNPDGTEKWHYPTGYYITSSPAIGNDGTVYIGSGDNYLYALYPNGTLQWRFQTGDYVKGPPSIAEDGTIYIGSWDDYLYALYPNGTMKWKCKVGYGTETNPSIASDGTIYVGGDKLYAVYPNGTIRWSFDMGPDRHIHQSSPAISADGIIYVGTNIGETAGGEIIAVNPDGTERWRKMIATEWVDSSPSIAEDGTVYIGSAYDMGSGYLHAFGRVELEADANGPYFGIVDEPVQFTGSAGGGYPPYTYHWDFGDEGTSEEQNPTQEYSNAGNYTVTLTVTDDNDSVAVDITWALIRESNEPPSTPSIDGETEGNYGEPYDYTFITTDIDGDNVWYYIEWGDGDVEEWIGPYSSGEEVIRSHTWDEQGEFTIRAKAKDIFDAESDWGELEVTMPVNQQNSHPLLERIFEQFPNAFPILRQLLGL